VQTGKVFLKHLVLSSLNFNMSFGRGRPKSWEAADVECAELLLLLKLAPERDMEMILNGTHISVEWKNELTMDGKSGATWYNGRVIDVVLKKGKVWHQVEYDGEKYWHNWNCFAEKGVCKKSPVHNGSRVRIDWILQDGKKQRCIGYVRRMIMRGRTKYFYVEYEGEKHWHQLHECTKRGTCMVRKNTQKKNKWSTVDGPRNQP
jgi:hypothetical protein